MQFNKEKAIFLLLRLSLGFLYIWAFFDKLLGLGFATTSEKAWLYGGSPTYGFLKFGTQGVFESFFQSLAGNIFVDWLFMIGLLCIGSSLIIGIGTKIAAYTGSLLMILMWLAHFPPQNNPLIDEHIIYSIALFLISINDSGRMWKTNNLVKKYRWLE